MKKPCDSDTAVQSENERYVKYYELQACLKDSFESFSKEINKKLDDISNNTKGLVTYTQHKTDLADLKEDILTTVDLKYGSTKNNFGKISWMIVTAIISIIVSVITSVINGVAR